MIAIKAHDHSLFTGFHTPRNAWMNERILKCDGVVGRISKLQVIREFQRPSWTFDDSNLRVHDGGSPHRDSFCTVIGGWDRHYGSCVGELYLCRWWIIRIIGVISLKKILDRDTLESAYQLAPALSHQIQGPGIELAAACLTPRSNSLT